MTFKEKPRVDAALRQNGLSLITVPEIRWQRCDIKSVALLPNSMAKNDAVRRGYDDAIFVTSEGEVREATAANVFAVFDGTLVTPPRIEAILHGVTRGYVVECAHRVGIECHERPINVVSLAAADEVFISSTTLDVMGVTRLNDAPVGGGQVGPLTTRLYQEFESGITGR